MASSVRTTLRAFEDSWTVQVNQDSRIQTDTHTRAHTHPGVPEEVIEQLRAMGHEIVPCSEYSRAVFGRGQIIRYNPDTGVMCAGSDGRADGCAMGW